MQAIRPIQIILLICMLVAAASSHYLKPTIKMADQRKVNLEQMIPTQFGDWKMLPNQHVIELPPELAANLSRIYTETLSRTYVNSKGQQVMLSIAYGADQSDGMGVHRPEVCYPAQGFSIKEKSMSALKLDQKPLPTVRLVAQHGERIEPITYWMVIGNERVLTAKSHKIAQISYGLQGVIPDGMLVRASTISNQTNDGFDLNDDFLIQLKSALKSDVVPFVYGNL